MKPTDKYIIELIEKGNEEGFTILFERYSSKVFYLCIKYLKNVDDANDCVQEVFMKTFEHLYEFNSNKSSFSTWIYTITINQIKDRMKANARRNRIYTVDEDAVFHCPSTQAESSEEAIILSEIEKIIGEQAYYIIFLRKVMKLSFGEIGKELNMSTSKVKHIFYNSYKIATCYLKKGV